MVHLVNLVFLVHSQILSSILFCSLRSDKVVFGCGQSYVIEQYPYRIQICSILCILLHSLNLPFFLNGGGGGGGVGQTKKPQKKEGDGKIAER